MATVEANEIIDEVLATWSGALAGAHEAYRGHVYRVYHCARALAGSPRHDEALAVAAAFHDLGIWSDGTFDYLAPSIARARAFLAERGVADADLVAALIANHHRLRSCRDGADARVVEAFRRADLVDVSRGLLRGGVDRARWRELVATYPFAGFHGVLVRTGLRWALGHPLRPLPMLRF